MLYVCYRKQIDLNRESHFTWNFWNATLSMLFEHILTWLSKHYYMSCHGSSFKSVFQLSNSKVKNCILPEDLPYVMKEKNNKLFSWCRWDEVIGCKKLNTSCSYLLCFGDQACSNPLISVTEEIYFLGISLNISLPFQSHEVVLQKTASH